MSLMILAESVTDWSPTAFFQLLNERGFSVELGPDGKPYLAQGREGGPG